MASGLPAVVINQGGVIDLVREGETGYICEPDAGAFATAIRQLRDHPERRAKMAYEARCYAEAHPWSAIMAQLEGYYAEALRISQRAVRVQRNHRFVLPIKI
jgi:glycosyltransferase involved in cell wall biosynthesis